MENKCDRKVICLTCSHWYYSPGADRYSEWTPGNSAEFECKKGHYDYCGEEIPYLFDFLKIERECKDYEHFQKKCK